MQRILIAILFAGCGSLAPEPVYAPAPTLPSGSERPVARTNESLRLILHDPSGTAAPTDGCWAEHCRALLDVINNAEDSIDFAIYGMRNQTEIKDAIFAAKARGVRVRGVVDRTMDGKNYYTSTEELVDGLGTVRDDLSSERARAGRKKVDWEPREPICRRPIGFNGPLQCLAYDLGQQCLIAAHASREDFGQDGLIMHHKFVVADQRVVWTGSTNVSDSGTGGYNANLVVLVDSTSVARRYTEEFELMYSTNRYHHDKPANTKRDPITIGDMKLEILFSPQHKPISRGVRPLLQKAKHRIDVGIFFLTHKGIASDLISAKRRGVDVRIIMDATASKNGYTKHEILRAAGVPVKIEHWGGKMHAKSAAIDNRWVITGSMNWTSAGEGGNDENTIIIESGRLASQYHDWFDGLWRGISPRWLEQNPDPESINSSTACTDGVDNDFDKKSDAADPGCSKNPPPLPSLPPWKIVPKRGDSCREEMDKL